MKPIAWWCSVVGETGCGFCDNGMVDPCLDIGKTHEPVYTASTIRRAWEEFAKDIEIDASGFPDSERRPMEMIASGARSRAKQW